MKAAQRAKRDQDVVFAKLRGLTYAKIGETYGLSPRHCKRIVAEHRETTPTLAQHEEALELAEDELGFLEAATAELAIIRINSRNGYEKIRAIVEQVRISQQRVDLLLALGMLPRQPRPLLDGSQYLQEVLWDFCRDHGLGHLAAEELYDRVHGCLLKSTNDAEDPPGGDKNS